MPEDPTIAEHLGDTYRAKGLYEKAIKMYREALSLEHQKPDDISEKIREIEKLME